MLVAGQGAEFLGDMQEPTSTDAEKAVTTVLQAPYTVPLHELRQQLQFETKGAGQTNDVIVLVDHWSLWERV